MNIAVIGAAGMLGTDISDYFEKEAQVSRLDLDEIDITQRERCLQVMDLVNPDVIINSAAFVDVDACETDPDTAWAVNARGAQNLALAAVRCNADLVYISTDYVFDGTGTRDYKEYDPYRPINTYGQSKLYGEEMSRAICPRLYVTRTSWLFGHSPKGYVQRILNAAAAATPDGAAGAKPVVHMAVDQLEAPTYSVHLAEAIANLVASGCYGTYHISGGAGVTRAEFARTVLETYGIAAAVEPISDKQAAQSRKAVRPARVVLDCGLYALTTGSAPASWQEGVKQYRAREQSSTSGGQEK